MADLERLSVMERLVVRVESSAQGRRLRRAVGRLNRRWGGRRRVRMVRSMAAPGLWVCVKEVVS